MATMVTTCLTEASSRLRIISSFCSIALKCGRRSVENAPYAAKHRDQTAMGALSHHTSLSSLYATTPRHDILALPHLW
jgi:hypothetical protein